MKLVTLNATLLSLSHIDMLKSDETCNAPSIGDGDGDGEGGRGGGCLPVFVSCDQREVDFESSARTQPACPQWGWGWGKGRGMCFEDTRDALEMRLAPQMSSQMSSLSFADDDKLKRKSEDTSKGKYTRIFPSLCALLDDHLGLRVDERQSDGADPPHGEPGKRGVGDPLPPVAGFSRSVDTMFSLSS